MLTFAAQPRLLNLMHGPPITFPARVVVSVALAPAWLFGAGPGKPQFVKRGSTGARIHFNANTGRSWVEGGTQPDAIATAIETTAGNGEVLRLEGNIALYEFTAASISEIVQVADGLLYGLPAALGAYLQFPCIVERVAATINDDEYGYEYWNVGYRIELVDSESQNALATASLRGLMTFTEPTRRRLQAALVYFHRACRLVAAGHTRWEFMAEAVLNLAKCLESLWPSVGEGKSQDSARAGLSTLGISGVAIETWFVPTLLLRNHLDVAHVRLAIPERNRIQELTEFVEGAIPHFRSLLGRILASAADGAYQIQDYELDVLDGKTAELLDRIAAQVREFSRHETPK
jgi:hypothetical protein